MLRAVFGDWPRNSIVKAHSPTPFNPDQTSGEAFGNALRPNLVVGADPVIEDPSLRVPKLRSISPVADLGMARPP